MHSIIYHQHHITYMDKHIYRQKTPHKKVKELDRHTNICQLELIFYQKLPRLKSDLYNTNSYLKVLNENV